MSASSTSLGASRRAEIEPPGTAALHSTQATAARLPLAKNFAWTIGGRACHLTYQAGVLVILARLGGAAVVGGYALALAVAAPLFMLADCQLKSLQASDAVERFRFIDYFGLRCVAVAFAFSCTCLGGLLLETGSGQWTIVVGVALGKSVESLQAAYAGHFQQRERMDRDALATAARGSLGLATLALLLATEIAAGWALLAAAVVQGVVVLMFDVAQGRKLGASLAGPSWKAISTLAWTALPLGTVSALSSLTSSVTRFAYVRFHDETSLAFFAVPAFLLQAFTALSISYQQAGLPRLAKAWHADRQAYRGELTRLAVAAVSIGAMGVVVSCCFGRWILTFAFGPEYGQYQWVLVWLMATAVVVNLRSALRASLVTMRMLRVQAPLALINLALTSALSLLLIPRHGIAGMTAVTFLSALFGLLLTTAAVLHGASRRRPTP